jgi:multiple sugar transport system substrate-binding protein
MMRMQHQRVLATLVTALCLFLGAAIAQNANVRLVLAISPRELAGTLPGLIDQFEQEHPNIEIEWLQVPGVPGEQYSLYVNQFIANNPTPDVIAADVIWPAAFAANGWISPLDPYLTEGEADEFVPALIEAATYQDQVYAMPFYQNGVHLFYRTDLLEKYGFEPPETWEELIEQARTILAGERNPTLRGYVSMWDSIEGLTMNYLQFLWGAGGSFFDENGELAIDSPESIKALQTMVDMIHEHGVAPESILTYRPDDARTLFQQGRSIFMVVQGFVWPILTADDSLVKDDVAFMRVPYFEGFEDSRNVALGGWLFAMNSNSRHKEEAMELIRFLTSVESQALVAAESGNLPTRAGVDEDPALIAALGEAARGFEIFNRYGNVRPSAETGAHYPEVSQVIQDAVSRALHQRQTPEEALAQAAAEIKRILGQ